MTITKNYILLKETEVLEMVKISNGTLRTLIKQNKFPKPYKITQNRNVWVKQEVQEWINNKIDN